MPGRSPAPPPLRDRREGARCTSRVFAPGKRRKTPRSGSLDELPIPPARALTALSACRGVLRKLGVHSVLAREANGWHAVLVDEGTIHSAHYVLVHVNHPPRREDVEVFCRLVPMPDLVVHVAAPLERVLARTFARSDPPLRRRSKEEMERFIRHAYMMFDVLMSQETLSRKTLRVQCDDDDLGAYRIFAKRVVDRIAEGSAGAPRIAYAV